MRRLCLAFALLILVGICARNAIAASGVSEYTDASFGFSFWYPSTWQVNEERPETVGTFPGGNADTWVNQFPGGKVLKEITVHDETTWTRIWEVTSPSSTITFRSAHLSNDKYYYDTAAEKWMVRFKENGMGLPNPSPASIVARGTTMSGLVVFGGPSAATFIIPLNRHKFIVVDNDDDNLVHLERTIVQAGAHVDPLLEEKALQTEIEGLHQPK